MGSERETGAGIGVPQSHPRAVRHTANRVCRPGCASEIICRNTAVGVHAYEAQLERDLRDFRAQRAWQAMLFLRKAYTYLVRHGWRGRLDFLKQAIGLSERVPLEAFDLQFPSLREFLPLELSRFADSGPSGSGIVSRLPFPERYDVVVLPVFDFSYRFQRPQQVAVRFASAGHRVFWVSPTKALPQSSAAMHEMSPLRERIWEVRLKAPRCDVFNGELSREAENAFVRALAAFYAEAGLAGGCLVVELPFWRRVALAMRSEQDCRIVFDCMDDWETMPGVSEFNRSEERRLVRECDALVVSGERLFEKFSSVRPDLELVRNGADYELFSAGTPAAELESIPRPIVGYFGAIADWFDYGLLAEVAKSRPRYSFVLVGGFGCEQHPMGEGAEKLRRLPNVHLLGHRPYTEMPSIAAAFDVCIIPFVLNEVTRATDPVKLYEYFSLGKPVVATDMSELRRCGDLLHIARDAAEFASGLDAAIEETDPEPRQRRVEFARKNSWGSRFEQMNAAIVRTFPKVSIVIVTHNSEAYAGPCLESLARNTSYPSYELVVLDNASGDGTPAILESYLERDGRAKLLRLHQNTGFAGGNNLAAAQATGQYLIFLNIDTIVPPGWIERLLRHFRRDPSIGLLVPVTNSAGNELKIDVPYTNEREMEAFALRVAVERAGANFDVECGPFFCAVIPRRVWERVGGLDERFGIGMFEDDDYSIRVRAAGYRVACAEDCFVHHFGQGSFSKISPARYQSIFDENKRKFEEKWGVAWKPHCYRPGVRPEGGRFTPEEFCSYADGTTA